LKDPAALYQLENVITSAIGRGWNALVARGTVAWNAIFSRDIAGALKVAVAFIRNIGISKETLVAGVKMGRLWRVSTWRYTTRSSYIVPLLAMIC